MKKLEATVKLPDDLVGEYVSRLMELGVKYVDIDSVPYDRFVEESRLNYDCSFPQMWTERKSVSYLRFSFDDSEEGRNAAFAAEYEILQIPLNLRYCFD